MYMNHEGKHGSRLLQIAIVSIVVGSIMLFGAQVYHSKDQFICVHTNWIAETKCRRHNTSLDTLVIFDIY